MRKLRVALFGLAVGIAFAQGLVCAGAAVAALGGRHDLRLDGLAQFAPFWLAGGGAVMLFSVAVSERLLRLLLLALGATAVTASAAMILPEFIRPASPRAAPGQPGEVKLIQYNTWARNLDLARTTRWLADQDADLIVMEEATPKIRDALLERADYHVTCKTCSVMIFSRAEPVETGLRRREFPGPRPPMTRATFASPHGRYTVIGVHYTWPTPDGLQQAQGQRLAELVQRFPKDTLIVAGDFNSTPWSFNRRREDREFGLERRTRALFSWPAGALTRYRIGFPFPFLPIDHVYAGSAWRTVKVERGPKLGSDHFPVIVTLAPTTAEPRP